MPTLRIELPGRVSEADFEALRGELASYGYVDELPSASYDPQESCWASPSFRRAPGRRGSGQLTAAHAARAGGDARGDMGGRGKTCDTHHSASDGSVVYWEQNRGETRQWTKEHS